MNGPEKSDSGIVAEKPTNKAGQPVAELVEPRPETKGNADQQSMYRTQSRAGMSQALDRVRKLEGLSSPPKVGAECPNWARSDLCGGLRATCVPTAKRRLRCFENVCKYSELAKRQAL